MSYLYNVRTVGTIVHVELGPSFVISLGHLLPLWGEVLVICRDQRCHRVLVEGLNPPRDMGTLEAFKHGDFLGGLDQPGLRIAFCLYEYASDEITQHFRAIANAGSCDVMFFKDIDVALAWLAETGTA